MAEIPLEEKIVGLLEEHGDGLTLDELVSLLGAIPINLAHTLLQMTSDGTIRSENNVFSLSEKAQNAKLERKIIQALEKAGDHGLIYNELAEATNEHPAHTNLSKALNELIRKGEIKLGTNDYRYRLTSNPS